MSLIYILGTDKKIEKNSSNLMLEEVDISYYKKLENNDQFLTERNYYLLNTPSVIGYDIRNIEDFDIDINKKYFQNFLKDIKKLFYMGLKEISLYQFVERNDLNIQENILEETQDLSLNPNDYKEDFLSLNFNTKYRFIYEF